MSTASATAQAQYGVVLPLARLRLTAADRAEMGRKMMERRNIPDRP